MPDIRPLSPFLQQIAINELHENPDDIENELANVRQWIQDQPDLGKYQISDQFLLNFLRSCKHNQETFRKKLPIFVSMRLVCPEIFTKRKVNGDLLDLIRTGMIVVLPTPMAKDQSRIHISNYGKLDVKQYNINEGLKLSYMMMEMGFIEDDHTAVAGFTSIEDLSDISFSHVISMNLMVLKRICDFVRCGLPHRIKGIHIVNAPWYASGMLAFARSFLPAKLKSRFFIHRSLKDLYKHVPQNLLPAEYGGENESIEEIAKVMEKKLQEYGEYFDHDLQFGTGHEHKTKIDYAE